MPAARRSTRVEDAQPDWAAIQSFADLLRVRAAALGDKPAFIWSGGSISFADVHRRVNRLNNALRKLGLARGDRVAILSRNRPEYFEVYAVAAGGFIAVPLNWRLAPRELLHPLRDSRPSAIVAEAGFTEVVEALRDELPSVRHFIAFDRAPQGWRAYERLLEDAPADELQVESHPDDPVCITYSSGTTGVPKGAVLTQRGTLNNCRAAVEELLGLRERDVGLAVMPLFHVGGMWYHLFPSFAAGCTTIIHSEFDPRAVLAAIDEHGVTHVHLVPTMLGALMNEADARCTDLSRLRLVYYAASPIPLVMLRRAMEMFDRCGFVQSFGSTEAGSVTALTPDDHRVAVTDLSREGLLLSCGRPYAGVQISIRDFSGKAAPPGEVGDIAVKSDRVMARYWENPASTAQTIVDGWLHTGDIGYLDSDEYLYIVDRKHDMIVTGGENVYPREVEDALYLDADLAEVAVFAIPDPKWIERVAAAVVLKPGRERTGDDIRQAAARHLASYKCPKTIIFVDQLPKNATGKVLKRELRRQYAGYLVGEVQTSPHP